MTADAAAAPATSSRTIPRPAMTRAGRTAVVLLLVLGVGALAGGAALVSQPDGSVMKFPLSLLAGSPYADGCGQMIWIVVELAIIKELSFLHPTMFGIGLAIAAAAVPWGWPTFQGWRAARG